MSVVLEFVQSAALLVLSVVAVLEIRARTRHERHHRRTAARWPLPDPTAVRLSSPAPRPDERTRP